MNQKLSLLSVLLPTLLAGCQETAPVEPITDPAESDWVRSDTLATFAGGCFWCVEAPFEKVEGVESVLSGFTGGHQPDPSYEEVGKGGTGHAEAVQIRFDPTVVRYSDLLQIFWRQIDPTDAEGQFVDRGSPYRPAIFVHSLEQERLAEASKRELAESGRFEEEIVVPIVRASVFYPAEDYHQDYYKKDPVEYHRYRSASGRDQFLDEVWGDERNYDPAPLTEAERAAAEAATGFWVGFERPPEDELRQRLDDLQFRVTQEDATERAFENEYWDNKEAGIYVDVVSGEPLFSSQDKFKSGTGWPSFFDTIDDDVLRTATDFHLIYPRTELRSRYANSHLGHVFDDGPEPTGKRYCINSAALRFIPVDRLEAEGYGRFADRFR